MQLWRAGLRFLLQSSCPLCDRTTPDILCQDCTRQLRADQYNNPQQDWRGACPLFAWGRYEGSLKRAIAVLKYNRQPQIGELLGAWLGEAWKTNAPIQKSTKRVIVVPVPLHRDREKQRGFNQSAIMAQGFCQRTGFSCNPSLVMRSRATAAQFQLSAQQRQENLSQAFSVQPFKMQAFRNTAILILDDIYTTGSTVRSLATILKLSGLEVLGVVAIAKTEKLNLLDTTRT